MSEVPQLVNDALVRKAVRDSGAGEATGQLADTAGMCGGGCREHARAESRGRRDKGNGAKGAWGRTAVLRQALMFGCRMMHVGEPASRYRGRSRCPRVWREGEGGADV